ncbi:GNAT family N-acetyltransferase [Bacillus seohaeanensis]|uniref:GNAT family N-acetyltransferase n=1 Tax=Bacillus seohaeanensis TaxID=284580 RepID=A0ABW5RPQ9_9BACI
MKKPTLLNFPEKIESERLYIRPCLPGDGKIVHEAIVRSKEQLKMWLPFAKEERTVDEVEDGIRQSYAEFIKRTDFRLHIFLKETDEFIGSTGFHRVDWEIPKVEIGYWLDTRHTRKGYMREVVQTLTTFAFDTLQVNRVEIRCDEKNIASRRIPEKLGYVLEGTLRNDDVSVSGPELRNTCIYAVIPSDWK